jgi:hypothetical protein
MRRFFRRGNHGIEVKRRAEAAAMAGRIRSIKPEILDDEKTAALHDSAWRLFVSLWLVADDYGNFRAVPEWIAGQVFWVPQPGRPSVEVLLHHLVTEGLVELYTVRGQRYGTVAKWKRHQMVQKPGNPRVPGPGEADKSTPSGESPESLRNDSRKIPESAHTDSGLIPIPIPISDPDRDPDRDRESERKHAETDRAPDGPVRSAAAVEERPEQPATVADHETTPPPANLPKPVSAPEAVHIGPLAAEFERRALEAVRRTKGPSSQSP